MCSEPGSLSRTRPLAAPRLVPSAWAVLAGQLRAALSALLRAPSIASLGCQVPDEQRSCSWAGSSIPSAFVGKVPTSSVLPFEAGNAVPSLDLLRDAQPRAVPLPAPGATPM